MGLLQPESGLLFWMVISFGVVFVLLAKFGFPVITRMVEERLRRKVSGSGQAGERAVGRYQVRERGSASEGPRGADAYPERGRRRQAADHRGGEGSGSERRPEAIGGGEAPDTARKGGGHPRQIAMLSVDIAEKVIRGKLDSSPAQMTMIERMLDEMPSMKQ